MNKATDEIFLRSGKLKKSIDRLNPKDINVKDIHWALSRIYRFSGQGEWSVLLHSIVVSCGVPKRLRRAALYHDAAEAYLGDLPSFIKKKCPAYCKLEERTLRTIFKALKIKWPSKQDWTIIKLADLKALNIEKASFYS